MSASSADGKFNFHSFDCAKHKKAINISHIDTGVKKRGIDTWGLWEVGWGEGDLRDANIDATVAE